MKRLLSIVLLLLAFTASGADTMKWAVFSDTHWGHPTHTNKYINGEPALNWAEFNTNHSPNYIFFSGDLTEDAVGEYQYYTNQLAARGVTNWWGVVGNHDGTNRWISTMPNNPYRWVITNGNYLFIGFYGEYFTHTRVWTNEVNWLENVVTNSAGYHIIPMSHFPLNYQNAAWGYEPGFGYESLMTLFTNASTAIYIGGHVHQNGLFTTNQGVLEVTVAPQCCAGDHGQMHMFTLVDTNLTIWLYRLDTPTNTLVSSNSFWVPDYDAGGPDIYYVATNGNNGSDGRSWANAWRTISNAVVQAPNDSIINLGQGDFAEYVQVSTKTNLTFQSVSNATTRAFRFDTPSNRLDGITMRFTQDAGKSWGAATYLGVGAHFTTIHNCKFIDSPWVMATNFAFNGTNDTITSTNVNFVAAGFEPGGKIVWGGISLTNAVGNALHFTNQNRSGTIVSVATNVLTMTDGNVLENEWNMSAWSIIYAGSSGVPSASGGNTSIRWIVTGTTTHATNTIVSSCLFSNGLINPISFNGGNHLVTNCVFAAIHGERLATFSGFNLYFVSNYIHDCRSLLYYSEYEAAFVYHPGGAGFYDFVTGLIHSSPSTLWNTNQNIKGNWFQNIEQPIGQFDEDSESYPNFTGLFIVGNVFVGTYSGINGAMNDTHIESNTFWRCSYGEGFAYPVTVGGSSGNWITNMYVQGNIFAANGDHQDLPDESWYSISFSGGTVATNNNYRAGVEANHRSPLFANEISPLGADGIPFTADDGIRPLTNSLAANIGALSPVGATNSYPLAMFVLPVVGYLDYVGSNYSPGWQTQSPVTRTNRMRPWDTPDAVGAAPCSITFSASNSISGTWSQTNWHGIRKWMWNFGDGSTAESVIPTVTHTYLWDGEFTVSVAARNIVGNQTTTSKDIRILPQTNFSGTIWHVSTTGDNSDDGTNLATAFLTVSNALENVVAGDYVAVHPGTYSEYLDVDRDVATSRIRFCSFGATMSGMKFRYTNYAAEGFTFNLNFTNGGNNSAVIYLFQAADSTHIVNNTIRDITNVIFAPIAIITGGNQDWTNGVLNTRIVGNIFTNAAGEAQVNMYNGSNCLVQGNQFYDTAGDGDIVRPLGVSHTISDNYVKGSNRRSEGHQDLIQIPSPVNVWCKDIIIERNWFEGWIDNLAATNDFAIGQMSTDHFAHQNYTNVVFRNNVFLYIRALLSDSIDGIKFHNNLFYRCIREGGHITAGGGVNGSSWGTDFRNNIFFEQGTTNATTGNGWYYNATSGAQNSNTTVTADYNLVYPTKQAAPPDDVDRWAVTSMEANGINGSDPLFVNASTYDFRLATNSAALSAGQDLSAQFTTDFLGNPRSGWAIGPFEEGAQAGSSPPNTYTVQGRNLFRVRLRP